MLHVFIHYKNISPKLLIKCNEILFQRKKKNVLFYFNVINKLIFGFKKLYENFKMEVSESIITSITEWDSTYLELKAAEILEILIHK